MVPFPGQLISQIQCYLKKLEASLPPSVKLQDQALIEDAAKVEDATIHFSREKIASTLEDAAKQLKEALPELKDPKLHELAEQMMHKIEETAAKFASGKALFKDIFTLNTEIRDNLKGYVKTDCGASTSKVPASVGIVQFDFN